MKTLLARARVLASPATERGRGRASRASTKSRLEARDDSARGDDARRRRRRHAKATARRRTGGDLLLRRLLTGKPPPLSSFPLHVSWCWTPAAGYRSSGGGRTCMGLQQAAAKALRCMWRKHSDGRARVRGSGFFFGSSAVAGVYSMDPARSKGIAE